METHAGFNGVRSQLHRIDVRDNCGECGKLAELYHNDATGLSLCDVCDLNATPDVMYSVTLKVLGHVVTRNIRADSPEKAEAKMLSRVLFKIEATEQRRLVGGTLQTYSA